MRLYWVKIEGDGMSDAVVIYAFVSLMVLNMFASFLYLMGLDQARASVRRAFRRR